jgi:DNA-binding transcriptional ArsR family regulator
MTSPEIRKITEARVLSALTHPLRRRLLDVLKVDGPATVGVLATRTGQAVGNVSHHLRVLGECGLAEIAPELARDRRERWWRAVSAGVRWSSSELPDDAASQAVARAAESLNLERQVAHVRAWQERHHEAKIAWQDASFSTDHWLRLTPDELRELSAQVIALLGGWASRTLPDDGQERETVFVFARGNPAQP